MSCSPVAMLGTWMVVLKAFSISISCRTSLRLVVPMIRSLRPWQESGKEKKKKLREPAWGSFSQLQMINGKWPFENPLPAKLMGLNLSVIEGAKSSHGRPGSALGAMPPTGSENCGAQSPTTLPAPSEPIRINSWILIKSKSLSKFPLPKAELQTTSQGNSLSLGIWGYSEFPAPAQAVPVDFQLRFSSRGCCESLSSPCSCTGQSQSSSLQSPMLSAQTNPQSAQAVTGFMNNRASWRKHQLQMQIHCCLFTL